MALHFFLTPVEKNTIPKKNGQLVLELTLKPWLRIDTIVFLSQWIIIPVKRTTGHRRSCRCKLIQQLMIRESWSWQTHSFFLLLPPQLISTSSRLTIGSTREGKGNILYELNSSYILAANYDSKSHLSFATQLVHITLPLKQ